MNKDVTIIFVTYHSEKRILKYLKQFKNIFKVIVVENSQNYDLKKLLKKYSNTTVLVNKKNTGFGSGANLGLKKIKTKYGLHIDLDTTFKNNSIFNLIKKANSIKDFTIIGPKIKNFDYKKEHFIKKKIFKNCNQMNFIDGCCLFFNMKEIKKTGFFDSNFFLYFEETDLFKRCLKYSKKIFMIDNIEIYHEGGSSSNAKLNLEIELNRNWHYMWSKFYYFKKHYNYLYAFIKIFGHIFSAGLKILFYSLNRNKKKKLIYIARFSGCLNGILLNKSWYRPKLN